MGKKGKRGRRNRPNSSSSSSSSNRPPGQPPPQPPQDPPPRGFYASQDLPVRFPFVSDDLVQTILSRGVPPHLDSFQALKSFLEASFSGSRQLEGFFSALAKGLKLGAPRINNPVPLVAQIAVESKPLILWLTQHEWLNTKLKCRLSHTMVDLVLRAGGDANTIQPNGTNPLFFAVKYGSLETLDLLLQVGGNIQQRDQFGRTCFNNALEHPKPNIIRRLLEYLPATEVIESKESTPQGFKDIQITLVDALLNFCTTTDNPPVAWVNLGEPNSNDVVAALMLLRQAGGHLTEASNYSLRAMEVACVTDNHPQIRFPKLLRDLSRAIIGVHIPNEFRPNTESIEVDQPDKESDTECPICLLTKPALQLYCGHAFCQECIVEYGKDSNNNGCPICRARLCRDLSPNQDNRMLAVHDLLGIRRGRVGLNYLSNDQVAAEAKAQGFYSMFSSSASLRSKLEQALETGIQLSQQANPISMTLRTGSRESMSGRGRTVLDLANTAAMVQGTPPSRMVISPCRGLVGIDVTIQGIPVLARISNHSLYTVLSRPVVEQLGLKRIETLSSSQFVDVLTGQYCRNSTFTCLEPITITIHGEIDVTLHNAIEVSNSPFDLFGVQLGQDFLYSGLFCAVDVEIGADGPSGTFFRVVGEHAWPTSTNSKKESFRYYSHHGKMAELPLLHFTPFDGAVSLGLSLREDVAFSECSWCCRIFPKGMLKCAACRQAGDVCYYCDERCQRLGWKIHKRTRRAHADDDAVD